MKFLSFIGALYILLLTVVPCTDHSQGLLSSDDGLEQHDHSHDHDHDHDPSHDPEDCSPLCVCQCCHIHVTLSEVLVAIEVDDFYTDAHSTYIDFIPDSPIQRFLKPPRA